MKNSAKFVFSLVALVAVFVVSCKKENTVDPATESVEIPVLPATTDNYPESTNDNLATLGRVLFYDKIFSRNNNISCGSCHKQSAAFTDNQQFSLGTDNLHGTRNAPSIFPKNGRLFWDGRTGSLEELALMPVRNSVEMNMDNIPFLVGRIAQLDYYQDLFNKAFHGTRKIDSMSIKKALAEFLKNFNFSNNKFHRSEKGEEALTPSEQSGKDLFFGKAKCGNCHHIREGSGSSNSRGYGQTDEFHNIGLDAKYEDDGVGALSNNTSQAGSFMMPVLLNVEFTAPYMHDGRFKTLEEVVEHYNSEIKDHPALDRELRDSYGRPLKLHLTDAEKAGLVDFLKSLSDYNVFTDSKFSDPFIPRHP